MIKSRNTRLKKLELSAPKKEKEIVFETKTLQKIQARLKDQPSSNEPFSLPKIWKMIRDRK